MARLGTGQASLQAIPELAARGGGRAPRLASLADVEREVERVRALGARYLFQGQNAYPSLLAEMESAPPVLIFRGRLELFRSEEQTSDLQSLMRRSYAVFCLKKQKHTYTNTNRVGGDLQ